MKTLRSKLLLAMLSIALIITVLLSLVSVYFINVSAKDTLKSTAEPLAVQAAKNFDSTISSYTNNIVSTVKSDSFLGAKTDADRLKAVKSGFADNTGFYLNFTVFDGNGIVLATDNEMVSSSVEKEHVISACERSSAYIPLAVRIIFLYLLQQSLATQNKKSLVLPFRAICLSMLLMNIPSENPAMFILLVKTERSFFIRIPIR